MSAIFKREFRSFFNTPLGYVILIIFNLFSGVFFWFGTLQSGSVNMTYVFSSFTTIVLAATPILTMRLLSEERRQKTDQALLTAPVSLASIVLAKYFAALLLYVIGISMTLVYSVILAFVSQPTWGYIIGNYLGLFLIGAALLAVGVLISSLTENQLVSAIVSYATMFLLLMIDSIGNLISVGFISKIFGYLSFQTRYDSFVSGIISIDNIMFFLSVAAVCLFLTTRVLEKRRWS